MRGRRWLGVLRGNEEDGEFLGGGLGALFYCEGGYAPEREGRRGTRRNGAQTDERAGVENEAQGLKPGEGEKQGTGSSRGEMLQAFVAPAA